MLLKLYLKEVDNVVILVGLVGDPITKKYPDISKKINLIYLKNIIDLIKKKKICKTIFISTCSNYGLIPDNMYADEGFKLNPLSLYAKAKVSIERYIISQIKYENFNPTILRFATAFGLSQRMRFDLTVNEFTRDILLGKSLEIYDKNTWRPYCHVKDFARLIKIVIESKQDLVKFETFNAGGDKNNATKKNIIDKIADHIEVNKIKYLENGFDTRNYKVDFTKVKRVLNFIPKYDISDGIKEIINELSINDDKYANKLDFGNYKIEE